MGEKAGIVHMSPEPGLFLFVLLRWIRVID